MDKSTTELRLSSFDKQRLDGLSFCIKVYDFFNQVKSGPDGLEKIRLRPTDTEKRLVEELMPIARYVQTHYEASNRFQVCWVNGSQSYDAILYFAGEIVEVAGHPKEVHLEATTSVDPNDYLAREQLNKQGMTWGPSSISRDRKTREITSQPHAYTNDEHRTEFAEQIIQRVKRKSEKTYPPGTILVVNCVATGLVSEDEWQKQFKSSKTKRCSSRLSKCFSSAL